MLARVGLTFAVFGGGGMLVSGALQIEAAFALSIAIAAAGIIVAALAAIWGHT